MTVQKNILRILEQDMERFSKGQKRIARYILDHAEHAAALTAGRLGELAQVSESTVVRFASELGYGGYPEMQRALQDTLRSRLTAPERLRDADTRFSDLPGAAVRRDMETLRLVAAQSSRDDFRRVVEKILSARHVYILGVRSSSFVAGYLNFYLHFLLEQVTLVQSNAAGEIFEQLFRIGAGDVMIAISFPRYSPVTVNTVKFARDRGASIVAVTDNVQSPVHALSDASLLVPCEMISFVDSMVAPLSMMNALLVELAHRLNADASEAFSRLEDIWNEYGVFGRADEE
ncbi:MAG: MurR/RpiR family transcriptional regulator [Oscillibacter sp.]|nr:MurR/RpiR family transcriptional regulator [Oscillibacter sp.]